MKIGLTYSSKNGLLSEFKQKVNSSQHQAPEDYFAEGDSFETIHAVMQAIKSGGHDVTGIEADNDALLKLAALQPDLVMNMAEGLTGDFRESYIPMLCERLGLPYTGSDPLTLALCLNKSRTKEILSFHHIPTPAFQVFYPNETVNTDHLMFPAIVKPVAEGSSKGIYNNSVVQNPIVAKELIIEKLLKYQQPVLVETFLTGDEFTVAVWGNADQISVLPIVAIRFEDLPEGAWPMYSYEAKWIWDVPEKPLQIFQCPAPLSKAAREQIESIAMRTYQIMGVRDWCRIDIRMDSEGLPHVLELNPLPGILPNPEDNSCFPKAARTAGYTYNEMIQNLISISCRRNGVSEKPNAIVSRL